MKENSTVASAAAAARFSLTFDDEDGATQLDGHAPATRSLSHHRTTFSSRFAEASPMRPMLDSDDEEEAAPIDFPVPKDDAHVQPESAAPQANAGASTSGFLAQIRSQLGAGREEALRAIRPEAAKPSSAERPAAELKRKVARQANKPAPPARRSRFWLGPLVMLLGAAGAYLVSATSLGLLGPSLSRRAPRVPDLGTLNGPQNTAHTAASTPAPGAAPSTAPSDPTPLVENLPLPEGEAYPGRGLLEIVTSERELVYVDGIFIGRGPLRRIPLQPGQHAIVIRSGGIDRSAHTELRAGGQTRVHFEGRELPPRPAEPAEPE